MKKTYCVSNIEWDVEDGNMTREEEQEVLKTLPREVHVTIDDDLCDEDYDVEECISGYLTEEYGFCHDGFTLTLCE